MLIEFQNVIQKLERFEVINRSDYRDSGNEDIDARLLVGYNDFGAACEPWLIEIDWKNLRWKLYCSSWVSCENIDRLKSEVILTLNQCY